MEVVEKEVDSGRMEGVGLFFLTKKVVAKAMYCQVNPSNEWVYFPKRLLRLRCPVEGCLGGSSNWTNLQVHFAHRHAQNTIVILEEGN